ncbi:MAG: STAS/SEC14 domain-containing protein [Proteobacteria bacterium]|nr:STAS/SEC14 domain-containing protein [Pseudomonadota bacterium]
MIQVSNKQNGKLVHLKYEGVVTHDDYQKILIPKLKKAIKTSSPLRAFCDMRTFEKIESKAMLDDFKFGIHHIKNFERIATVGDQWWMSPLIKVSNLFLRKMELKHFKSKEYKEAQKWLDKKQS